MVEQLEEEGSVCRAAKDLQHMKADEKLKGVSSKFSFLTSSLWQATSVSLLKNPTTKLAEYPRDKDESLDTKR